MAAHTWLWSRPLVDDGLVDVVPVDVGSPTKSNLSLYGPVETLERGVLSARFMLITVLHVPLNLPNIWVVFTCFAFSLIVHLFLSLCGYLH